MKFENNTDTFWLIRVAYTSKEGIHLLLPDTEVLFFVFFSECQQSNLVHELFQEE